MGNMVLSFIHTVALWGCLGCLAHASPAQREHLPFWAKDPNEPARRRSSTLRVTMPVNSRTDNGQTVKMDLLGPACVCLPWKTFSWVKLFPVCEHLHFILDQRRMGKADFHQGMSPGTTLKSCLFSNVTCHLSIDLLLFLIQNKTKLLLAGKRRIFQLLDK